MQPASVTSSLNLFSPFSLIALCYSTLAWRAGAAVRWQKEVTGRNERVDKKSVEMLPFHSTPSPCSSSIFKEQKPVFCEVWSAIAPSADGQWTVVPHNNIHQLTVQSWILHGKEAGLKAMTKCREYHHFHFTGEKTEVLSIITGLLNPQGMYGSWD